MTLYHGSTIDIPCIDLSLSKPNKDFGRAFYLSDDRQQALEMAQFRAEFEETEPVVNVYEFDESLGRSTTTTSSMDPSPTTASAHRLPVTSRATSLLTSFCAASSTSKVSPSNTPSAPNRLLTN